jgi:hypothetical protein
MGPAGRLVGGLKGLEFDDKPIPQCSRLIGREKGFRTAGKRFPVSGIRWCGR